MGGKFLCLRLAPPISLGKVIRNQLLCRLSVIFLCICVGKLRQHYTFEVKSMPGLKLDLEGIPCIFCEKSHDGYCLVSSGMSGIGFQICTLNFPPPDRFAKSNGTSAVRL